MIKHPLERNSFKDLEGEDGKADKSAIIGLLSMGESVKNVSEATGATPARVLGILTSLHDNPKNKKELEFFKHRLALYLFNQMLEIADTDKTNKKWVGTDEDGEWIEVTDNGRVNRDRLRVETRKWMAEKLWPQFYGQKLEVGATSSLAEILQGIKTVEPIEAETVEGEQTDKDQEMKQALIPAES